MELPTTSPGAWLPGRREREQRSLTFPSRAGSQELAWNSRKTQVELGIPKPERRQKAETRAVGGAEVYFD